MNFLPVPAADMASSTSGLNWSSLGDTWGTSSVAPPDLSQMAQMPSMSLPMLAPGSVGQSFQPGFMDQLLGYRGADGTQFNGWGSTALGAANGLMSGFLGMKQLGLAKDQLAQGKKQFEINFGAQQKLTNSRLEDRQRARISSNPGAYQSVGDYMKKNGI